MPAEVHFTFMVRPTAAIKRPSLTGVLEDAQSSQPNGRNVYTLGATSFLTDASTEMILSVLPLFLSIELRASRGLIGLIEGLGEGGGYGLRFLSGLLSDRLHRRKILVVFGYTLSALSKPILSATVTPLQALLVRVADRVGKGIRTAPRDALLSQSVPSTRVGWAFGLHRSLDQAGAVVGPGLAALLLLTVDMRSLFLLSLIPGAAAVLVLLLFVREARPVRSRGPAVSFTMLWQAARYRALLLVSTIFSAGAISFAFVLLRAADLGVPTSQIPLVFLLLNAAHTAVAFPVGRWLDRVGGEKLLILGYAVYLVAALLLLSDGTTVLGWLAALVFGIFMGVNETVPRALVATYVPVTQRASGFGLYFLVAGLAFLAANALTGWLWDVVGTRAFAWPILTSLAGVVSAAVLLRTRSANVADGMK